MVLTNYSLFHADLYSRGLDYAIEHTLALGFDTVEFLGAVPKNNTILPDADAAVKVAEKLAANGLKTACYSVGGNLYCPERAEEVEREFILHAEIAAALQSPYLHHTFFLHLRRLENFPAYETVLNGVLDATERIANFCASHGITCLYEPQGVYFNGVEGLGRLLDAMRGRCTNIGVCGDIGNPLYADTLPQEILANFAADVKHAHIKDYYYRKEPIEGINGKFTDGGNWVSLCELGKGDLDIVRCLQMLKDAGYSGAYAMEFTGDDDMVKRSLSYFRECYRRVYGE